MSTVKSDRPPQAVLTQVTLGRYGLYLATCRSRLVEGVYDAPFGPLLGGYLERGKMVRALLVFLSAAGVGGDPAAAMPAAEAAELCHGASLFHDDIMDEATDRRGLPALHVQVGNDVAIALGDYLLLRAFAVLRAAEQPLGAERMLQAVGILARCGQECCAGQIQEVVADAETASEEAYLTIIRGKTASLLAGVAEVGALLGGGTPREVQCLRGYGEHLGIAFQIGDDLLDLVGDSATLGKPVGNSLSHGRPLLPLIYLKQVAGSRYLRWERGGCDHRQLESLLRSTGALRRTRLLQEKHVSKAMEALNDLAPSEAVDGLKHFARMLSQRQA